MLKKIPIFIMALKKNTDLNTFTVYLEWSINWSAGWVTRVFQRHVYYNLVTHASSHAIGAQRHHLDNIAVIGQQVVDNGTL